MPEEGTGARLVRNTLANGLGTGAAVVISLVLTPFMIDELGLAGYGIWTIALTLTFAGGYAGLTELGVEASSVRYIAEARSSGDLDEVNRIVSTTTVFFVVIAVVLTVPLVLLASSFVEIFDVPEAQHDAARLCFALVAGQLVFELPARSFFAVLEGSQRFPVYQAVELTRALVQLVLFVLVLATGRGIGALGGALAISSAAALGMGWVLAHRTVPTLRIRPRHVSRTVLRKLLTFGSGLLALRVMGTMYRQMDKVIVGLVLGPQLVTTYEVANKIHGGAAMVQSVSASALVPAAAYSRSRADVLKDMFLRGSAYTVAVSLPVVVAALIFAEPLIRTWIGDKLLDAVAPTRLFLVYLLFVSTHVVGATMLVGLGRLSPMLKISGATLAINLGASLALVGPLGVEGVILGTVIAYGVAWPVQLWIFLRELPATLGEWLREVLSPNLPGLALQLLTAAPLLWLANRSSTLLEVAPLFLLSILVSLAAFVSRGLDRDRRDALILTLRRSVGFSRS